MQIGCVILAAGNSFRFGDNKLLARYGGKALIEWVLDAVPAERLGPVCVVTQYPAVAALAEARGFSVVWNRQPELGIGRSVALGTTALAERCDGILFLAADQPLLRRQSLERLLGRFLEDPSRIVAASSGEHSGNPAVFPAALFPELEALAGDRGGKQIIRRFPELVTELSVDHAELADVDTPADLARM